MRRNLSACHIFIHTEHYMCDNPICNIQVLVLYIYQLLLLLLVLVLQTNITIYVCSTTNTAILPPITVYLLASHSFLLGHIGLDSPYIVRPSICSIFHFQCHRFMAFDLRRIIELQNIQLCIRAINIICISLKSIDISKWMLKYLLYVCIYVLDE